MFEANIPGNDVGNGDGGKITPESCRGEQLITLRFRAIVVARSARKAESYFFVDVGEQRNTSLLNEW